MRTKDGTTLSSSRRNRRLALLAGAVCAAVLGVAAFATAAPGLTGAIYSTDVSCSGVNVNIFDDKDDVYLNGGPQGGGSGLPDGEYYVKVEAPGGTLLGTSIGATDETPVVVSGGAFAVCYQLSAILIKASDSSPGYDDTTNNGGEYKITVSPSSTFDPSKTDNFKVRGVNDPPGDATVTVDKCYDANANGTCDSGEVLLSGWKVNIKDTIDYGDFFTPVSTVVLPDTYHVSEYMPVEPNWIATSASPVDITVAAGETKNVTFTNVCLGAGGGLTLGFWSNKNGQALVGADDRTMLSGLNLRNASGSHFDPGNNAALKSWLLSASATNMAYMLSAQLAAMELNVYNGNVAGGALIYAPGATSANALGFATVNAVMAEANTELGLNGLTLSGHASRSYQEALKNALDKANNNLNFVQAAPCAFSFAP